MYFIRSIRPFSLFFFSINSIMGEVFGIDKNIVAMLCEVVWEVKRKNAYVFR